MSNLDPNSVPVPVHFDGHNINIITEDSPSMCKDRIRNLTLYKTHIKKKRNNGFRKHKMVSKSQIVNRGPSSAQSAEASPGSTRSSFPDEDSKSNSPSRTPSIVTNGGFKPSESSRPSYSSKLMKDTPEPPPPSHDGEANSTTPSASPSKKGLNTNATPFVMSPSIGRAGPESNDVRNGLNAIGRHREDYMVPPRHREYGDVHRQKQQQQPQRVTDEMLIAQGYDPNDFGSYDDPDEDDQKMNYKGKDRRCLFKTELCREWSTSGWCYYNRRCSFAHGLHELRPVFRSKKWRTKRCRNWHTTGYCPYEHRCQFLHDQNPPRRMNDYSQTKGQSTQAGQEKMKPLYFHYQVEEAANDENQEPSNSNRDETPSKDNSQGVDKGGDAMEQPPRKRNKDTVITQFNPTAQPMYDPSGMPTGMQQQQLQQNNPYANLGAAPPTVAAPFPMYPPTGLPTGIPTGIPTGVTMPMMNGGLNAPLMNPLMGQMGLGITGMAASPAPANCNPMNPLLTAVNPQLMTTNPPSNVDSTVYLHFTPSPPQVCYEEEPPQQTMHTNMNNMNNMMSLAMSAVQNDGPSMEMPASLTPPPASMYEATNLNSVNNMAGQQQQQLQQQQRQMYMQNMQNGNVERDASPTPSCILMDENILLDLLPADAVNVEGQGHQDHSTRPVGTAEAPESSVHSNTRKSTHSKTTNATEVDDDAKEAEDMTLSMAGLAPPCPPALQLQTSDESVVMGAVDAAFLSNNGMSPATAGIHVPALQVHSLISQQAHVYAQAHATAAAQVHNGYLIGSPMTPMTPLNMTPAFDTSRSAFSWNIPMMSSKGHPAQTVTAVAPASQTVNRK